MNQYYVQSGTLRVVVAAENRRKAALWAVHEAMSQILPIDDGDDSPEQKSRRPDPRNVLGREMSVSPIGFDRDDPALLATIDVVAQWNEMVTTLDRLERLLTHAA